MKVKKNLFFVCSIMLFMIFLFSTPVFASVDKTQVVKGDGVKVTKKTNECITFDFSGYIRSDQKEYEVKHLSTDVTVRYNNKSKSFKIKTNATSFTLSNLVPAVSYMVDIEPLYKWTFDGTTSKGYTFGGYTLKGTQPSSIKNVKFNVGNYIKTSKATKINSLKLSGSTLQMKFNKSEYVDGYQYEIYYMKGKKFVILKNKSKKTKSTSVKLKGLSKITVYYARVRTYKGERYSKWSSNNYFIHSPIFDKDEIEDTITEDSVVLKWNKVNGAKSYEIYCSDEKNGPFSKIGITNKTKFKVKGIDGESLDLTSKKWFYVVAITKIKGKIIDSVNSSLVSCKYE